MIKLPNTDMDQLLIAGENKEKVRWAWGFNENDKPE